MNKIDKLLNNITMYRLVIYVLGILASLSIVFAFMGRVSFSPTALVGSLLVVTTVAYVTDEILGRLLRTPVNMGSAIISGGILFLILQPAHTLAGMLALALAGALSSASKFLLSWNGKHIFNPAALAATIVGLLGLQPVVWWIGSSNFWLIALLLGLAVVRKVRRFPLVITFAVVSIAVQYLLILYHRQPVGVSMKHALLASPLIFLGTIMLTEPATMPPRRGLQVVFGALVAVLYVTAWRLGPVAIHPEVALLLGNIFAFAVSPKFQVRMRLQTVQQISGRIFHYSFLPERRFTFLPGQYLVWTLPGVGYDSRGNRRTFTVASSPTEDTVQLGLKYYEPASAFKAAFERLKPGDTIYASQLAGNFTMQGNAGKKLAFIAGGIGITPFRSMIKYLTDTDTACDITLIYVVADPREFAYLQEFTAAAKLGVRLVRVVTNPNQQAPGTLQAQLDAALIAQTIPDFRDRIFYVSGPNTMVNASKGYLRSLGVTRQAIHTDHFSGY